jgi:hypothetical protein
MPYFIVGREPNANQAWSPKNLDFSTTKAVFLDVDGVLNGSAHSYWNEWEQVLGNGPLLYEVRSNSLMRDGFQQINPLLVEQLISWCRAHSALIVVSSYWRSLKSAWLSLKYAFEVLGGGDLIVASTEFSNIHLYELESESLVEQAFSDGDWESLDGARSFEIARFITHYNVNRFTIIDDNPLGAFHTYDELGNPDSYERDRSAFLLERTDVCRYDPMFRTNLFIGAKLMSAIMARYVKSPATTGFTKTQLAAMEAALNLPDWR